MTILQQKIQAMSARERVVLVLGTICSLIIVFYVFVWQPWQDELNRLRTQVPIKQETLLWMKQQLAIVQPLLEQSGTTRQDSNKPLLTVIEQSAKQSQVNGYIRRMAPGENDQVKIWLTDADFDRWIIWLEQLRQLGIEVEETSVNRTPNDKVTIRVTLHR